MSIGDIKLQPYQEEAKKEVLTSLKKYNQAVIHLCTGGGKSFIMADVLNELRQRDESFKVVYISRSGSCSRVRSLLNSFDTKYWNSFVTYITFSELQRNEKFIDTLSLAKVDLLVIDEAHGSLATETYKGIQYIQTKFPKAGILAMSANDIRYDSKRFVFKHLAPKLTEGKDYKKRDLNWAIENKILCKFIYRESKLRDLAIKYKALEALRLKSEIYRDEKYNELYERVKSIIDNYCNAGWDKTKKALLADTQKLGYDGHEGDRWFIFYNTVAEIREDLDKIREVFEEVYACNPNVKINILEFHNANPKADELEKTLNGPAVPNEVDVIITCIKGSESFHPENTRGIIMNRRTRSENNMIQMLGRALEILSKYSNYKLIYDNVSNKDTLNITQTIFNGTSDPDLRRIASLFDSKDEFSENLLKKYQNNVTVIPMDNEGDIEDALDRFNEIRDILFSIEDIEEIGRIWEDYKYGTDRLYKVLYNLDVQNNGRTRYTEKFKNIQRLFILGEYGNCSIQDAYRNKEKYASFIHLYDTFGYELYRPFGNINTSVDFVELVEIAEDVKRYNYDYHRSISRTKELKSKIARLRYKNLNGQIPGIYQRFCTHHEIDIDGRYTNLVDEIKADFSNSENTAVQVGYNKFKEINKAFKSVSLNDKESVLRCLAKEHVFTITHNDTDMGKTVDLAGSKHSYSSGIRSERAEFSVQASNALRLTYRDIIVYGQSLLSRDVYESASGIIRGYTRIKAFENEINNISKYCDRFNDEYELPIIKLVGKLDTVGLSVYEEYVLDELGIKAFRGSRDKAITEELLYKIPFGIAYKAITEAKPDTDLERAFRIMERYNAENLPDRFRQLLRKRKFRKSEDTMKELQLYKVDNPDMHKLIRSFTVKNEITANMIRNEVSKNKLHSKRILLYALQNINTRNSKLEEALYNVDKIDENTWLQIRKLYDNNGPVIRSIVKNLRKMDLLPKEHAILADGLINKTIRYSELPINK